MSRRIRLFLLTAAAGLFLYLVPALRAPVVLWSDSVVDLQWAKAGAGILAPPPSPPGDAPLLHPAKPGWLLFLRSVQKAVPSDAETRAIVVVQSLVVWGAIVATAILAERRRRGVGLPLLIALFSLLRLRDMSSAVLPEVLSAALLLPLVPLATEPPRRRTALVLLGLASAVVFWIRPNVGGIGLALVIAGIVTARRWKDVVPVIAGFVLLVLPVWIATRPREEGESLRGLAHPIALGTADYNWSPEQGKLLEKRSRQEVERLELEQAKSTWQHLLRGKVTDVRRQIVWRTFHGLFGTEFYDSRWSAPYARVTSFSRVLTPFLTALALAALLAARLRGSDRAASLGLVLIALLVAQNLFLLSHPRFVLPFLPALYYLALTAGWSMNSHSLRILGTFFVTFLAFLAIHRYVLDWEWGRIERAGVAIRQRIPIRSLPQREPATLHVRIASPIVPTDAHIDVLGPGGEVLYSSTRDDRRAMSAITVPLPASLLDANARGDVEIELRSSGAYGELRYLLFPVVPRPWGAPARRVGSSELSPTTGIRAGSVDWWAHTGRD